MLVQSHVWHVAISINSKLWSLQILLLLELRSRRIALCSWIATLGIDSIGLVVTVRKHIEKNKSILP